ncbi:MAG: hypothetical protein PHP92_03775 [Candidatus Nanoarchaeia archaeon]|nr:hypothetical protein [Candidatus Nanoarchaeia archaeon]
MPNTINCKFCNTKIPLKLHICASEIFDDYTGQLDNMQGGSPQVGGFDYKKDMNENDIDVNYLGKGKKHYPGKKDIIPFWEDDVGVSTVAYKVGKFILVKCGECKTIYAEVIDPSRNDVYHNDNYISQPETAPIGYPNETHQDYNKVRPSTDVDLNKVVKKVYRFKKERDNGKSI